MAYFLDPELAQLVRNEQSGSRGSTTVSASRPTQDSTGGGRRNKFAAPCIKCGKRVPAGAGSLDKTNGAWVTAHLPSCP